MRLAGKVAIVTGAAGGLGTGIARRLAEEGATVVCADLRDATATLDSLTAPAAQRHRQMSVDVTDKDAVEQMITSTSEAYGRLDVLCNNAGTYQSTPMIDASDDEYHRQFTINTWSVFVASRAAGRLMQRQGAGRIINTASQLAKVARSGSGIYAASKAAVILMTQALALELAPHGVTANCICPGTMQTAMMTDSEGRPAEEVAASQGVAVSEAFRDYIDAHIPVGRLGQPEDMGALVAWLASDEAGFVTGAALNLTGGEQVFF
jgi:NAD(P)-dependent dehydrogenase (short-subunit alcohol dehydrogenase family)